MGGKAIKSAIILVGGWGTRLLPLTKTVPKPLVPFCNRPMVRHQIEKLVDAGVTKVVLAIGYYSEQIMAECRAYGAEYGIEIIYSRENTPLGTGGPLALARRHLAGGAFFVMNSDICSDGDLARLRDAFFEDECDAAIMTYQVDDPTKYGLVVCDGRRVASFVEKPKRQETGGGPWIINAGMYVFSEAVLDAIEEREMSLEKEVFPQLASRGRMVHYLHRGYWIDVGQIGDYLIGQRLFLTNRELPGGDTARNVVIGMGVTVGENVVLENCTIFDNVQIGAGSTIRDSVIGWGCVIGQGCLVESHSALGKSVVVEPGTVISGCRIMPSTHVHSGNIESFCQAGAAAVKTT